jgi:hypothetical protein
MANTKLTRTPGGSGSNTTWTFSCWFKKTSIGADTVPWATGYTSPQIDEAMVNIGADDQLRFNIAINDSTDVTVKSKRKLRDTTAWYHIVVACDTTQATDSNRVKFYINGELETVFENTDYPTQGQSTFFGDSNKTHQIGIQPRTSNYLQGELSHVAFVDGQQLAPTVFGETDSTSGIWKWKDITGVTWGTNGFYLKFENSAALGTDSSGQSNTFTVAGSATRNIDNPSVNYNTLNGVSNPSSGYTLSNANTECTVSGQSFVRTFIANTLCPESGKWYWESKLVTSGASDRTSLGICSTEENIGTGTTIPQNECSICTGYSRIRFTVAGSVTEVDSFYTVPSAGDIFMYALDLDNTKFYFGVNGNWWNYNSAQTGGNPTSGSGYVTNNASIIHGAMSLFIRTQAGASATTFTNQFNFGNGFFGTTAITSAGSNGNGSLFEYDVPSGYYGLNTKNINTYG